MTTDDDLFPKTVNRDRWGRPLITPPGGGAPEAYTRATTVAKALDDTHNLTAWKARMTARGVAITPSVAAWFASMEEFVTPEDKKQADEQVERAMERAKANDRRDMGTAIHKVSETLDRGQSLEHIPAEVLADVQAYRARTAHIRWLAFEQFIVLDEMKIAGTTDRIGQTSRTALPQIMDLKTGTVGDYNALAFAIQLAIYARGQIYRAEGGQRVPYPAMDLEKGVVIHVDQGKASTQLYEVDIATGWEMLKLALSVREARKVKGLMRKIEPPAAPPKTPMQRLAACVTLDDLRALYNETGASWGEKEKKFADIMARDVRNREAQA